MAAITKGYGDAIRTLLGWVKGLAWRGLTHSNLSNDDGSKVVGISRGGGEQFLARRVQPFGLATSPPLNSEAVGVSYGGSREASYCVIVDTNLHPRVLATGEVALYSTADNKDASAAAAACRITMGADGRINISSTTGITINGNVQVNGSITATGDITSSGGGAVSLRQHTHPYSWTDPGGAGDTSAPNTG